MACFELYCCFGLIFVIVCLCILFLMTSTNPDKSIHNSELCFKDPTSNKWLKFASIEDEPTVTLSVIVPSYNEETRLPLMLDEALDYLEGKQKSNSTFSYELIVVDDGSTDATSKVALSYSEKYSSEKVRVLTLHHNRGKGGAIRMGVLMSRGERILFADADGATHFPELEKLLKAMELLTSDGKDNLGIVCGSRAHLESQAIASRSTARTFLMKVFHICVWLVVRGVKDTQCGFKLLTRKAAKLTFLNLNVHRWAFDVDLLYIAQTLHVPISEVSVRWQEIDGSKIVPFWSWAQMGRDILLIRFRYLLGLWKITSSPKIS